MATAARGSSWVGSNLEEVLVRIEEVHRFAQPSRAGLFSRPTLVADRMERVSVLRAALAQAREDRVEVAGREREREMISAGRSPRRELQRQPLVHAQHGERSVLAVVREP